jgi:hypothetical protein
MRPSLAHLRRTHRAVSWIAGLVCAVVLAAGFASAAHVHKPDPAHAAAEHAICQLCIHQNGLMDSPVASLAGIGVVIFLTVQALTQVLAPRTLPHRYQARGPPRS